MVDEVRGQVATVKLHSFHHFQLVLQTPAIFDRDHAFLADFFHRLSDDLADGSVGVGRNGADLGNFFTGGAGSGNFLELFSDRGNRQVDATLQIHRVHPGRDKLHPFTHDRLCQDGRGGGAIPRHVGGLAGDLPRHLRAHVLELVFKLDLLRHNDTRVGDQRRAIGTLQNNVAAARAESHLDRIRQNVHASDDPGTGSVMKQDLFCRQKNLQNKCGATLVRLAPRPECRLPAPG